jgi:hypothetical protein
MARTLASSLLAQSIGPSPAWSACARTGSSLRGGTRQGRSAPLRDRLRRPLTEPAATGADLHQRRAAARHTFGGRTTRAHTVSIRASETGQSNYRIVRSGTQGEASAAGHTGVAPGRPPPSASAFPAGRCTHLPPRPGCSGHIQAVPAAGRVTPHRPTALFTMWGAYRPSPFPPGLGGGRHAEGGPPGSVLSPGGPSSKVWPSALRGSAYGRRATYRPCRSPVQAGLSYELRCGGLRPGLAHVGSGRKSG